MSEASYPTRAPSGRPRRTIQLGSDVLVGSTGAWRVVETRHVPAPPPAVPKPRPASAAMVALHEAQDAALRWRDEL